MKRFFCVLLSGIILLLPFGIISYAQQPDTYTEYSDDGDYIITGMTETVTEESVDFLSKFISVFRKIVEFLTGYKNITRTKYISYYDKNGVLLWTVYLTGTFRYNNKNALCKSVSVRYDVFDNDWKVTGYSCDKNGAKAYADFTLQQTKLGVKLKTIEKHLEIICDKTGNTM